MGSKMKINKTLALSGVLAASMTASGLSMAETTSAAESAIQASTSSANYQRNAQAEGYKWGGAPQQPTASESWEKETVTRSGYKWGDSGSTAQRSSQSFAEEVGFEWGTSATAQESGYRWGPRGGRMR